MAFAVASAARFAYGIARSAQGWTGVTYMEDVYELQGGPHHAGPDAGPKRRWGPLFVVFMEGYERLPLSDGARRAALRAGLTALYGATLLLLVSTMGEAGWSSDETLHRRLALVGVGLQSTPAVYAIANGMGEIVTAFCIVAHFVLFANRRYLAAALVICAGVYFKLYPIVFVFPYFVFAVLSRDRRRYCVAVAASATVIALASTIVAGWRYGFLYPLSMVGSAATDGDLIPILSKETFGPVSLISRAASGFRVHPLDARTAALARSIAPVFAFLLIASAAAAAIVLYRSQRSSVGATAGRRALTIFQAAIGFLMFAFSLDMSITLLLPIVVSLYAALWLPLTPAALTLFAAGSVLAGTLVPLSVVLRVLPLGWFDRLAGNPPDALIPHEKYLWYEVPMVAVVLLFLAFCAGVAATRERRGAQAR